MDNFRKLRTNILIVFLSLILTIFSKVLLADSRKWTFDVSSKYVFDSDKIELSGGKAYLKDASSWFNTNWQYRQTPYFTDNPTIQPDTGQGQLFTKITSFVEEATKPPGAQIRYVLSNDKGSSWLYWDGADWAISDGTYIQTNSAVVINNNISHFPIGEAKFLFKAFLYSEGIQPVELDSIHIDFEYDLSNEVFNEVTNYPNPFAAGAEETKICYTLTKDSEVTIRIYNLVGDLVREMHFSPGDEGGRGIESGGYRNVITWDGRNGEGMIVANGVYICQFVIKPVDGSGTEKKTRKIGVLK